MKNDLLEEAKRLSESIAEEFGVPSIYAKDGFVSPLIYAIGALRAEKAELVERLEQVERTKECLVDIGTKWFTAHDGAVRICGRDLLATLGVLGEVREALAAQQREKNENKS